MDLKFKLRSFQPPKDYFGDLPQSKYWLSSRFKVNIKFRRTSEWDVDLYKFIFDTGAYVSIAPDSLINHLGIEPLHTGQIHGIIEKKECRLDVKVAYIKFKLVDDEGKESNELEGWFAFHPLEKEPLLLGMNGILKKIGIFKKPNDNYVVLSVP